jgi:hypothetical protein
MPEESAEDADFLEAGGDSRAIRVSVRLGAGIDESEMRT